MFFRRRYDPWPDLLARSTALHRELIDRMKEGAISPDAYRVMDRSLRLAYENFTIYATVGRDRKKLGPEWVDKMEEQVREHWGWVPSA